MEHFLTIAGESVAVVSLIAWVYLAFFRGQFWRIAEASPVRVLDSSTGPSVTVIIPARNEATLIGTSVRSLLTQNHPGRIDVIVIDDGSWDGTQEAALEGAQQVSAAERLRVVSARPLPEGWTGKLWAISEGLCQVHGVQPDYFLLTDADILHSPENVGELVARAEAGGFDLVSLMVRLRCEAPAERALIPAFLFFFFMLYPPKWVSRKDAKTAAAAGGCILIRPGTLARIGGIESIRGELIDDCALARRVKKAGSRIYLGASSRTLSLREYGTWKDIEQMIARTAFTQLRHSAALLIATTLAMMVVFVAPPFLVLMGGISRVMGLCAWLLMSICYLPSLRLYKISALQAPLLPLISLFYAAATIHSAVLYWKGRGGIWKGRIQDSAA